MILTQRGRKLVLSVFGSGCAAGVALVSELFTFLGVITCSLITGLVVLIANPDDENISIKN